MNKKRFVITVLIMSFIIAAFASSPVADAKAKYKVKNTYVSDIGKTFKSVKKKYGWKASDGEFSHAGRCDFYLKNVTYVMESEDISSWEITNNSKCIQVCGTVGSLVSGMKKNVSVSKFVKKLYSKGKKASYEIKEAPPTAYYIAENYVDISFVTKERKTLHMHIALKNASDRTIRKNARVQIFQY